MKIIFFSSSSTSSGGTRQALYTLEFLSKLGHEGVFIVPSGSTIINKSTKIRWVQLPENKKKWKKFFFNFLRDFKPDVIHAYHNKAVKKIAWWSLFFKNKVKPVVLTHRGVVFRPSNPLPYWSPGIDCITANSYACAQKLHQLGVPKRKLKVIYNCLPLNRIQAQHTPEEILNELGIKQDKIVIGSIAGDSAVKGVSILLEAVFILRDLPIEVLILGATQKWRKRCRELRIDNIVHLLGHKENIADYLQIMDIFCIPSLSESMPNTLLEAIFAGLPIVSSKVGGIPEVLEGRGFLFKPGDFKQLALYLEQLITSESLREEIKSKIIPLQKLFLPEVKTQKLLNIYKELLQKNNG